MLRGQDGGNGRGNFPESPTALTLLLELTIICLSLNCYETHVNHRIFENVGYKNSSKSNIRVLSLIELLWFLRVFSLVH